MWWNTMSAFQQTMFIIACCASFALILQIVFMLIGGADNADGDIVSGGITDVDADVDLPGGVLDGNADIDLPGGMLDGADGDIDLSGGTTDGAESGSIFDTDTIADAGHSSRGAAMFGLRLLSLRSIIAFFAIGGWVGYTAAYELPWYYALLIAIVCGFAAACLMAWAMLSLEKLQANGTIDPDNAVGLIGTVYLTVPPARSGKGKINILIQERYAEYEAITDSPDPLPTSTEIKVLKHVGSNLLLVGRYKKPSITVEKTA